MKQFYIAFITVFSFLLQPVLGQPGENWLDGWDYRIQIEIDHEKVDATLSDFPVAVMLDVSNFDFGDALSNGFDIRFTDYDGQSLLTFEREIHDASDNRAVYWVRIPTVADSDSNTVFFIYYGNTGASDAANTSGDVWDANYRAVWHMDNDSEWLDEIIERKNGIPSIKIDDFNPEETVGNIGYAQKFDGNTDEIDIFRTTDLIISNNITISSWLKPEVLIASPPEAVIYGNRRDLYQLEFQEDNGNYIFKGYIGNNGISAEATVGFNNHVVLTYDNSDLRIYVNSELINSYSLENALIMESRATSYIGSLYKGDIDEVRVSAIARSGAWIKADYHSGNGDLLVFDQSGFDIIDPGQQVAGVAFDIEIENATGFFGMDLDGYVEVNVTSSIETEGDEEDGVLFDGELEFSEGEVTIPGIVLKKADTHTLKISIVGVTSERTIEVEVIAADASKIAFITEETGITAGQISDVITIQLQDEFGNEVENDAVEPIIVELGSDYEGEFIDELDDEETLEKVTIGSNESEASFRYTSTVAGTHTLTVSDAADVDPLDGDFQEMMVNAADPYRIVFITEEQIVFTGETSDIITIRLLDEFDNLAISGVGGITIDLSNDTWDGEFLDDEGNELDPTDQVYIAEGDSEVSFIYRPDEAGTHELTANKAGLEGGDQELIAVDLYTWTGNTNDKWGNAGNWSPTEIPGEDDYIIIPEGTPEAEAMNVTVRYLDIQDGGTLSIKNNRTFTIKTGGRVIIESGGKMNSIAGSITIQPGGQKIIQPGGSMTADIITNSAGVDGLLIESDATGTGSLILNNTVSATVQRYVKGNVWQIVSVPVSGMTIGEFLAGSITPNEASNNIFYNSIHYYYAMTHYDETIGTNGGWAGYYGSGVFDDELEPGSSYLIRRRANGLITFRGSLVPEVVNLAIPRQGSGWHSVGNPFPSALKVRGETDGFLFHNTTVLEGLDPYYAVVYIYDPDNPNIYSIIGNNGSESPPEGRPVIDQDYVQPGQGFLVRAKDGGGSIDFTAAMKSHQHSGVQFFKKSSSDYWPTIILNVSNESKEASTVITFNENMTRGLDVTYDAGLLGGDPDFRLYTRMLEDDIGINMAIQCLPDYDFEDMAIPVGFDLKAGGEVTFSTKVLTLPPGVKAILEDRELEIFTDLGESDYTIFVDGNSTGPGRFFLHVESEITSAEGIEDAFGRNDPHVYSYGKEIFILMEINGITHASLYDLTGRQLKIVRLMESGRNSFRVDDIERGIYIVRLSGANINKSTRLFIE